MKFKVYMEYCIERKIKKRLYAMGLLAFFIIMPNIYTALAQNNDSLGLTKPSVSKELFNKALTLDNAIQDKFPGLFVAAKSGMPFEGAYINFRGIHSFLATNSPLIVINGIPYFGNEYVSSIVNGYSRSVLAGFNVDDIRSVKLLKGTDAALYGSLGSGGVLWIETEQATSDNLDTKITYSGLYGVRSPNRTIPVLGAADFKNYMQDIGTTRYGSMAALIADYPFMQNNDNYYTYLFNNNTDWNSEIFSPSIVTDNVFRVEGGDAIAKYNMSFGYASEGGVLGDTKSERYHTSINTNIIVNRKVNIYANVSLAYIKSKLLEQGINPESNAIIAASLAMPMISPYKKEDNGNILNRYASYNEWNTNTNPAFAYDNVSNPLAIINTVSARDKIYDANIRLGADFNINKYLTISGLLNIYINYTEESVFIPGVTDRAIIPQYFGVGENTSRRGVMKNRTDYYGMDVSYKRTLNMKHHVYAKSGLRYMGRNLESDFASGYNTPNDYFLALNYTTEDKDIFGTNIEWKWLNYYLYGDYTYKNILNANFNLAVDGTSVSGVNAPRFVLFPSIGTTALLGNMGFLPRSFSLFNISAEISRTGNSRFSSNYAKNYYQNSNLFNLGTIVRSNVPNTKLECEKANQLELGLDVTLLKHFANVKVNYYLENAYDLLIARNISSVYGSSEYYDNTGEIETKGLEVALNLNPLRTNDINWSIGGSIAFSKSKIVTLGNIDELFISLKEYNNDDALIVMRKGESPYQYYGYRTHGVYSSTSEANTSGLKNIYGNNYQAGDVIFENNHNEDNIINAKDKVLLGSAAPDYFGSLTSVFRYRKITLSALLGYSVGNMAYNALRRELESMSTFYNQSLSVMNRWQVEGQKTSLPRAAYGDPSGNNVFSDRWLEDASYIKLRNVTLSYDFGKFLKICQSGKVYITAENVFTITDYLGTDPEFSYSYAPYKQGFDYAKVALPKTFLVGIQLYF